MGRFLDSSIIHSKARGLKPGAGSKEEAEARSGQEDQGGEAEG